jgi:hypothetical protein
MSTRLLCRLMPHVPLLISANTLCILHFKRFKRSEARGQRASGQHPATFASSGQRPEHESPEPSTLVRQIGCGMVQRDAMNGTQLRQLRNHRLTGAPGGPMMHRGPGMPGSCTQRYSRRSTATQRSRLGSPTGDSSRLFYWLGTVRWACERRRGH